MAKIRKSKGLKLLKTSKKIVESKANLTESKCDPK